MAEVKPIACTLAEGDLRQRLDEIAALGVEHLLDYKAENGVHTLRFSHGDGARRRLERVAAAEARCCSFLDLSISERHSNLTLTITATEGGEPVAQALALAFVQRKRE